MMFKPITPFDYTSLKRFFIHQSDTLCAYSLPSILVWSNSIYQPYGAILDNALIIYLDFPSDKSKRHLILPISPEKDFAPEALYKLALQYEIKRYCFVSENYMNRFEKDRIDTLFDIKEDKKYEDYVYRVKDLATLSGSRYAGKRNLIHQFHQNYVLRQRVKTEKTSSSVSSECIDFVEKWCDERGCDEEQNEDLSCEKQAMINALEHIDHMDMPGILIRIDGVVSAVALSSYLTDNMGALHFEKAFTKIKGLYQYLDNVCAKELFKGYQYLNKESDMGMPGLLKAKKSYHPIMKVKSYDLTLRADI
jgi:hypothetical protein